MDLITAGLHVLRLCLCEENKDVLMMKYETLLFINDVLMFEWSHVSVTRCGNKDDHVVFCFQLSLIIDRLEVKELMVNMFHVSWSASGQTLTGFLPLIVLFLFDRQEVNLQPLIVCFTSSCQHRRVLHQLTTNHQSPSADRSILLSYCENPADKEQNQTNRTRTRTFRCFIKAH